MTLENANISRKNECKTRGRPFQRGNPGKPKGARHRVTTAAEALLEGEAEAITRKAIELAKQGDGPALRLCLALWQRRRIASPALRWPYSLEVTRDGKNVIVVAHKTSAVTVLSRQSVTP